jgi:UDP-N-acetylmuramate dehydrogenase
MKPDFDLQQHNTFGLPARARWSAVLSQPIDVELAWEKAQSLRLPLRVLGGGSNVIFRPFFDGIIAMMEIKGRSILDRQGEHTLVQAGAGEDWHEFVLWTLSQNVPGLENLAGIPGKVGAAPIQNIGAYGLEMADRFHSLLAYDLENKNTIVFNKDDCGFGYRQSVFKKTAGRFIVLSVTFAMPNNWAPQLGYQGLSELSPDTDPQTVAQTVIALRNGKLPDWRKFGNAGSFFHNPVVESACAAELRKTHPKAPLYPQRDGRSKLSAAWLIERCGFKGFRLGGVGVSERHALVLVNYGDGTQEQLERLADGIKSEVLSRFGVLLHEEPETI